MSVLAIRHGLSTANNRHNMGTPAFAHRNAHLMKEGREQARALPANLITRFGLTSLDIPVATSTLIRTDETAQEAGFARRTAYTQLDEIGREQFERGEIRAMIEAGKIPQVALDAAEETLRNPPAEGIWFSHGLRIAAMCVLLEVDTSPYEKLVPRFCEVRELPL